VEEVKIMARERKKRRKYWREREKEEAKILARGRNARDGGRNTSWRE